MEQVAQSFRSAQVATTAQAFSGGVAQAVYVSATCSSGLVLTLLNGNTVDVGNAPIGTVIPIACQMATFSPGGVVALRN